MQDTVMGIAPSRAMFTLEFGALGRGNGWGYSRAAAYGTAWIHGLATYMPPVWDHEDFPGRVRR